MHVLRTNVQFGIEDLFSTFIAWTNPQGNAFADHVNDILGTGSEKINNIERHLFRFLFILGQLGN